MRQRDEASRLSTVSVVLPTLNERDNIVQLMDDLYAAVPDLHEVVVVDDDSTDGTGDAVLAYAAAHPDRRVRLELRTSDHGLTKSIAHGVRAATGEIVVWMDCDLSMPADVIPRLLHGIAEGYDIVAGSRFIRGGSFKKDTAGTQDSALAVLLSRLMNYGVQFLLDHRFKDYTSGFIAIRREIVLDLGLRGDYGEYFIDLMFRAIRAGYVVLEIPYVCAPRLHGVSKTGSNLGQYLKRGRGYAETAIRLRVAATMGRDRARRIPAPVQRPLADRIAIRPMREEEAPLVAGLHHRILFDTLNSRLGTHFLDRLYGALLVDPHARCWVAMSGDRLVAFVSATSDLHRTNALVTRAVPLRERAIAAVHVLANPHDLGSFLSHQALLAYVAVRFGRPYATLSTLGAAEEMGRTDVAERLVHEVDAFFASLGLRFFHTDAIASNTRAMALVHRLGFTRVGSIAGNVVLRRGVPRA